MIKKKESNKVLSLRNLIQYITETLQFVAKSFKSFIAENYDNSEKYLTTLSIFYKQRL